MSILLTEDQVEFQKTVRSFLASKVSEADTRELMAGEDGIDADLWAAFTELELHALGINEVLGGAGGTWVELGIVLEEMGARIVGTPFFASTVLAAQALAVLGSEKQREDWLDPIRTGALTATMALPPGGGGFDAEELPLKATEQGGGWRIDGKQPRMIDGSTAGLLLVIAQTDDGGPKLFAVERSTGVASERLPTLDQTRKMACVTFSAAPASLLDGTGAKVAKVLDLATIGLASEQLGGARHCLEMAVEYAGDRVQFGQAIGSFQAIKHKCANVLLAIEAARSNIYNALALACEDAPGLSEAASVAKVAASEAFRLAATEAIQIHGGIGFSWEHVAHIYLKRAKSSEILLGTPAEHRTRLAKLLDLG